MVRIAVTGHRFIDDSIELTTSINKVLAQIIQDHPGSDYQLLSALAEGSDQLVARVAQKYHKIKLIVPLPLPEEMYLLDFETEVGRKGFTQLLKISDRVITFTENSDHDSAYDYLGSFLIDQCCVLIAIWNGEYSGKRGGTGEVVKKALHAGKLIYWLYSDNLRDGAGNSLRDRKKSGEIQVLGKQAG